MKLVTVIKGGLIALFFVGLGAVESKATHLRAGEITARRLCPSLTFEITITVFTDIGPSITARFGGGFIDFGDGSEFVEVPIEENPTDLGNDVGFNQYTVFHTFPGNGSYTINYTEPNRNEGILNMSNSVNTMFHLETNIFIDPFIGCNDTPILLVPPIDRGCVGSTFFHNPGAFDPDGDSISYQFVIPKRESGLNVFDYVFPHEVQPTGTNEEGSGPATLALMTANGDIIWDAPALPGEYNIAFIVTEWRKVNGEPFPLGSVTRDMQIIIEDCDNERPEIIVPDDVCVVAGTTVQATVVGVDPDGHPVLMEAFGGPFEIAPVATITPNPQNGFQPSPGSLDFEWETACGHVRALPYQVEFKVTDEPPEGPSLVEFGSWFVTVVGPAPNLTAANLVLSQGRRTELAWDPYTCTNAEVIQVWRRVEEFMIIPDECETGMPPNAGYTLIATVPATATSYVDNNLDEGAKYCYRLVATFPNPGGGESIVSNEICTDPIEADAPVITHVTVDKTGFDDGEITVSWRSPFELNQSQFPPPYSYELWRANGFFGNNGFTLVASTSDTTFADTGLNTEDSPFNYRVVVFNNGGTNPIDTSASASSVWADPRPLFKEIELSWEAAVPWSNTVQDFPYHYIYRDNVVPGDPDQLVLIDSVNVTNAGFVYLDSGQVNGVDLVETTEYCYFVTTFGSYGNPLIDIPQINNSQIICAQPNDTIPPCAPILSLEITDCESFVMEQDCNFNNFSNTLTWGRLTDPICQEDIRSYNVYYSRTGEDGTFELIPQATPLRDTVFVHEGIQSFAGCYLVTAVDRSGNESEFSEMICNDNCPNFVLPNVFTPNNDGFNDVFSAFSDLTVADENNPNAGSDFDVALCPRFVESVHFTVFNRWGREVFDYQSGGENSIFINWDGKDNNGQPVAAGVYYYVADVRFDLLDMNNSNRRFSGWIQVLR